MLSVTLSLRRIVCVKTGTALARSAASPWTQAGVLCRLVIRAPATRTRGWIRRTELICASRVVSPVMEKRSASTGMTTSSLA